MPLPDWGRRNRYATSATLLTGSPVKEGVCLWVKLQLVKSNNGLVVARLSSFVPWLKLGHATAVHKDTSGRGRRHHDEGAPSVSSFGGFWMRPRTSLRSYSLLSSHIACSLDVTGVQAHETLFYPFLTELSSHTYTRPPILVGVTTSSRAALPCTWNSES